MRLLFLGDVMGRAGRAAVAEQLPRLRRDWALDFVVVNGENATGGMGLSGAHAALLLEAGADCVTLGDHAFDQRDMLAFIEAEPRIIRPLNFARARARARRAVLRRAGRAAGLRRAGARPGVHEAAVRRPLLGARRGAEAGDRSAAPPRAVIVEVHAEATSEKMALGHWCDGRASLVVGTHTHVPTADTMILGRGAAYQTDAGMCGDYDSVIGMDKLEPITRFVTGMTRGRFMPAEGEATLCGVYRRDRRRHRPGPPRAAGAARRPPAPRPARPEMAPRSGSSARSSRSAPPGG